MEDEKTLTSDITFDAYDAADRPFDFVGADVETALLCEPDLVLREKADAAIRSMGYQITAPESAKDALKNLRYHVYDLILINENFNTDTLADNEVLNYLANLNMSTRRKMFVAMISHEFRTGDNMAALHNSVNFVINTKNIDDVVQIIISAMADNEEFFYVFKEILRKKGRD
jgi:CheY-like chemotaxis protein